MNTNKKLALAMGAMFAYLKGSGFFLGILQGLIVAFLSWFIFYFLDKWVEVNNPIPNGQ